VVFPHEPVVRVSGPILQVQLAETLLLNLLNFESLIATKASRIRLAARDRRIVDFGMRRAQGLGCLQASRAAIIGGVDATSNVLAACLDGLETSGTVAHSWVQSFDSELEAFRAQARSFGHATVLLVDTYDTLRSGVPHAIQVAQEMSERGERLLAIRLDSGDLAYLSRAARGMLDAAGLPHVKIAASNQLDETVIKSLLDQEAPIDIFGVGTKLVTSFDCPALDGVYKLCSARGTPRMKLSDVYRKMNLPGDKRVYRLSDEDGTLRGDVVVLEGEKPPSRMVDPFETERSAEIGGLSAEPLFREVMARGRVVGKLPGAVDSARIARESLSLLPREHQRFENPHVYRVGISPELFQLRRRLVEESRRREQGPSPGPT
jgi:nicotinate phosphoribosyltransferase